MYREIATSAHKGLLAMTYFFGSAYHLNYNLLHDTLTDLRMAEMAPFSSRETCA